jgi:hypothetical protein
MLKRSGRVTETVFFLSLFLISLFLTMEIHHGRGTYNWQSEIWVDKAGYYIYLPATFLYRFDFDKFPERIDDRTGGGFILDYDKRKLNNKYSYGVALLVSPFFLGTHAVAKILGIPEEGGFAPLYHRMVNIAAVFYLVLGLWLLKRFLDRHFEKKISFLVVIFLYAGTNLFYYGLEDTLMSHVYSFFLFSLFLLSLQNYLREKRPVYFLLLSFSFSLAFLIRPTSGILLLLLFLWDVASFTDLRDRFRLLIKPVNILAFSGILFLVFLPQMIYWKYLTGKFLMYTYGAEGFSNWKTPFFAEVWFSPLNGYFTYTPLAILFPAGMILMIRKEVRNGWLLAFIFLLASYLFASWFTWYFACSYGQRSFAEYSALMAVPLGVLLTEGFRAKNLFLKSILAILFLACSYYNVRLSLNYEKCFFGSTWDWNRFGRLLEKTGIAGRFDQTYVFCNDFENTALSNLNRISDSVAKSGRYSMYMTPDREYGGRFLELVGNLGRETPCFIKAGIWIWKTSDNPLGAFLVCSVEKEGRSLVWLSEPLDPSVPGKERWCRIERTFVIPDNTDRGASLSVYIWNRQRTSFYADDLEIEFRTIGQ